MVSERLVTFTSLPLASVTVSSSSSKPLSGYTETVIRVPAEALEALAFTEPLSALETETS